jgi:hypothetical protein
MSRFQPTGRVLLPFDTTDELEAIIGHTYSDLAEPLEDVDSFSYGQRTIVMNQLANVEPARVVAPRNTRARSPTPVPIGHRAQSRSRRTSRRSTTPAWRMTDSADNMPAGEVVTHDTSQRSQVTATPTCTIRPIVGSSRSGAHSGTQAQADSDSEIYAESDGEFEDFTSSFLLEIRSDPKDMEKWEWPPRG